MAPLLATLFLIICILLIIVVLLQKGRGGGLGAAFGGMGSSAFGTRTGDVLTWVTIVLTAMFLLLAIFAHFAYRPAPSMVLAPRFDPPTADKPGGTTYVKIECDTPGAAIFYTLDGTVPTEESEPYKRANVPVEWKQTLTARAFRQGWKPSPAVRATYGPVEQPATGQADANELVDMIHAPETDTRRAWGDTTRE